MLLIAGSFVAGMVVGVLLIRRHYVREMCKILDEFTLETKKLSERIGRVGNDRISVNN